VRHVQNQLNWFVINLATIIAALDLNFPDRAHQNCGSTVAGWGKVHMGHFSMELIRLTVSLLRGNLLKGFKGSCGIAEIVVYQTLQRSRFYLDAAQP